MYATSIPHKNAKKQDDESKEFSKNLMLRENKFSYFRNYALELQVTEFHLKFDEYWGYLWKMSLITSFYLRDNFSTEGIPKITELNKHLLYLGINYT